MFEGSILSFICFASLKTVKKRVKYYKIMGIFFPNPIRNKQTRTNTKNLDPKLTKLRSFD
jgi:hypothetical protein